MPFWDSVAKLFGLAKKPENAPVDPTPVSSPSTAPLAATTPVNTASQPLASSIASPTAALPATSPASDFLPIKRDDLLQQAEEVRRTTGWMFFGRRDIIPPTHDPRTLLIDRGMVTQGFIKPEELAEIHTVGDEHAKHANRLQQITIEAGKTADQAVEADRAARAAIKIQKKAEAAARKQKRADEIAVRKATDIRFVGKGVSALLNDRVSDEAKLTSAKLPVLSTPADLAKALSLTVGQLRWLCFHTDVATRIHYVQFTVPKKSGGTRTLSAPHIKLAAAQHWIYHNLLRNLPNEEPAHGFIPSRSTLTNARPHAAKDLVINVDLENFFPSIRFGRVRAFFRRLGYSGAVATLLALLCTESPRKKVVYDNVTYFVATGPRGLPQGACTSPAISNQIARRLDRRLNALMKKLDFAYTRYADDLTFSALPGHRNKVAYLLARVRHICQDEGFQLNPKKTRVQRPESRQSVTGLVVNVTPAVPRNLVRRIRAILHRARTEGLDAQNREHHPNFRGWLEGMIAYIYMVKPTVGEQFRQQLSRL